MAGYKTSANVKFEFSRSMKHPTATSPATVETWESAPGFFEAKIHWMLGGQEPSWVECWFHAGTDRVFPWTRVRASDEAGLIGIYRFDQVSEEFSDKGRVWLAYGRCVLYGAVDNYMRSPRIYTQPGATDPDAQYTEWPVITPDCLTSKEDLTAQFGATDARVTDSKSPCSQCTFKADGSLLSGPLGTDGQTCRGYVFATNADREVFLNTQFSENLYSTTKQKLGPNYVAKGVRRGWVFKDILRHTSGKFDAGSRHVLGVYNRSGTDGRSDIINSNFSQAQAGGAGANALEHDAAISWPWEPENLAPPGATEATQNDTSDTIGDLIGAPTISATTPSDLGYDYRMAWIGKSDQFAASGQSVEVFRRGSQEWDDGVCFGCGDKPNRPTSKPCPVKVFLTFFQSKILRHVELSFFPTRAQMATFKPAPESDLIIGMGVLVTIVDPTLASYNLTPPGTVIEWQNRLHNKSVPLYTSRADGSIYHTPGFSVAGRLACGVDNGCGLDVNRESFNPNPSDIISHTKTICRPQTAFQTGCCIIVTSCLSFLFLTPTFPEGIPTFSGGTCFGGTGALGVYIHPSDITKDYMCYTGARGPVVGVCGELGVC